ncbi:MAG: hypothetical protein WCF67_19850 [Chitinophagaceae bacterium]
MRPFPILVTAFLAFCLASSSFAQTTFSYRNVTDNRKQPVQRYRNCIITTLGFHINDGKFDRAVNDQLGVIGNDFDGSMEIGMAPAEGALYKNIWFPIDGYKRSFIGKHTAIFSMDLNDGDASDDDWNVRLETSLSNPLIAANEQKLTNENDRKYPINIINGEIDIKQVNKDHLMEYENYSPKVFIDHIGMYGPWVSDHGWRSGWISSVVGSHGTYIEIHPMEQLWWTEKQGNNRIYHLNMANDNSGRYNERSDFDTDTRLVTVWHTNPMKHTYYIPFAIPLRGETVKYSFARLSENNITARYSDGIDHRLTYKGRTILTIKEPPNDIIKIDFINTGIDPEAFLRNERDTIIKGFIKIETSLGKTGSDYAGNLFLRLTEENPNLVLSEQRRFRVTLENITCISVDDGDSQEDIMGFIGVRAESTVFFPSQANHLPDNSPSPLLWAKLDGQAQKIKKDESIVINKSFLYTLPGGSIITLFADLDEDDGNADKNKTMLDDAHWYAVDDADDKLEKFGKMEERVIPTNDLRRGQSTTKDFKFGSGGTEVRFSVKVEAL